MKLLKDLAILNDGTGFGIEISFYRSSRWEEDYNKIVHLKVRFLRRVWDFRLFYSRVKKSIDKKK